MNLSAEILLTLANSAIGSDKLEREDLVGVDWNEVIELALNNEIFCLIANEMLKREGKIGLPEQTKVNLKNDLLQYTLREYKKYYSLRLVLEKGRSENIQFVVFKGCVLANLYSQYSLRTSCDTDLLIDPKEREQAVQLLETLGYQIAQEHTKQSVYVLYSREYDHTIELHTCLWEDLVGPKMEILESMDLANRNKLVELEVCNIKVMTLGYMEHLIYQVFHIIKHFSLEGISIRYVLDITLYTNAYCKQINWEEFWNRMEEIGYAEFCNSLFSICSEYFGMTTESLGRKKGEEKDTTILLEDLLSVGRLFENRTATWQILGIMTPYLVGEEAYSLSKRKRRLKILFPSQKALPDNYSYAKKHKILLPIAWVHKIISFVLKRHKYKDDWYNASEKMKIAEHRISLMNRLGLIENKK